MTIGRRHRIRARARAVIAIALALAAVGVASAPAGAATAPDDGVSAAVVGGTPIGADDFPSLVAIMDAYPDPTWEPRDRVICTGTAISRRWILSAGHCSFGMAFDEPMMVQFGSRDLGDPRARTVRINRAIVHRTYYNTGAGYDVALFHTADNVDVPPARLAAAVDRPLAGAGRTATLAGWGLTTQLGIFEEPGPRARLPVRARKADLPIIGDGPCAAAFGDVAPRYFVAKSDVCAGEEGHSACYGDSGGPLFATDPQGQQVEIGIVSRGAGCATKLYPTIFTDVRRLHAWIDRWTAKACPNRFTIDFGPDVPDDIPLPEFGPLYIC